MAQPERRKGLWVIRVNGQVIVENTSMRALNTAAASGGTIEFVQYGDAINISAPPEHCEVIADQPTEE